MAWEVLAIWAIVIPTVIWFLRDEKRRKAEADIAHAARYYAHAAKYRHVTVEIAGAEVPMRRTGGLSQSQRAFFKAFEL